MGTSTYHISNLKYTFIVITLIYFFISESQCYRTWVCNNGRCVKESHPDFLQTISIEECKITCLDYAGLWPMPTGVNEIGTSTIKISPSAITFQKVEIPASLTFLMDSAQNLFLNRLRQKIAKAHDPSELKNEGTVTNVNIRINVFNPRILEFKTHTDEDYKLMINSSENKDKVDVTVEADTFFGARHALETLAQLIIYDDIHKVYKMISKAHIVDGPIFTHRGITLDTARSYISSKAIEAILDLMAMNKMNTFHWHLTDSQSFPYVSTAYPELSKHGAYSDNQVYTPETIKNLVSYARVRGIRVIPEIDAPAHVGEGWEAIDKDLITCFKWEPWKSFCEEPPCGQFDPTNENLYPILGEIYKELVELFDSDLFHMGGDEVNINCWKSTPRITSWMKNHQYKLNDDSYYNLWANYQNKAYSLLKASRTGPHPQPILWSSSLTSLKNVENYVNPQEYIIQIWTSKDDNVIKELLKKKYKLIFSNFDELYLDCGASSWVGDAGTNWCSPYKGWQVVYNHSLEMIARSTGLKKEELNDQILGSEAVLWTEQVDESTVMSRLWPRSAALAERLWSNPSSDWKSAQYRMNHHRERIYRRYPQVEVLQPQWCYQNDGYCE